MSVTRNYACPVCEGSDPRCYVCQGRGVISEAAAEALEASEQERADIEGVWEDAFDDGGPL
ncbi:hypothetical protein [Deinococcus ruber]|uniref:Uncharacterized protein n=1 Tax=Deinococcus ruber TaxID=1848197 RepID=A0A918F1Z8_9DEIO|nr:hypothetical protein [Deinococcus ruber]GGR00153.1 hypothetical protein GCM10008957_11100 [Deinococcus ruber]